MNDGVGQPERRPTAAALRRTVGAFSTLFAAVCAWAGSSIGDFNGDGKADVLLRHNDGRWYYAAMDGRRRLAEASGSVALPTEPEYRLAGIDDFNGDGMDDVLLRHATTSRWYYYPHMTTGEVLALRLFECFKHAPKRARTCFHTAFELSLIHI